MPQNRALLMVDIVDSTAATRRLGEAAAAAFWRDHDQQSRRLLRRWHGQEVQRGDGFTAWFAALADAVAFVADYHRLLATLQPVMAARAGLHLGPLEVLVNSEADLALGAGVQDVAGLALAVAARLMGLAGGGQTLVTAAVAQALAGSRWQLQSHGHWRLKGFDEPLEVFEIASDDAALAPPADGDKAVRVLQRGGDWVGLAEVPHNLPAERESCVGRRADQRRLARSFDDGARLVTLLGIGGIGKTRLAKRFGWGWRAEHPGGVYFCDLAAATTSDGVLHAVAQALDLPLGRDPVAQIGHAIGSRGRVLLVLDNVEQVLRPMASTLSLWLDRAPQARFLATSRERLGLPDEQVLALDPLSAADAAVLFCQRASAHASDIAADDPSVLALVRLLDGLPLAIELAAARVHVLPPDQMLARMDQRFRLLAGGGSGRPERQATLHAALDWSWDLLGDAERSALAQLSVFEGGFTLAAAESVLDLGACGTAPWVPDVLQALVDKSLVRIAAQGRFDLLRSVQAYAAEQLCAGASFPASGSTLEGQAHSRHWRLFATLDARAGAHRAELENLSLACTRAAAAHDGAAASACLTVTWGALRQSGPYRLVPALAAAVRAIPGLEADHVAATEAAAAAALATLGDLVGAELAVARGLAAIDEARSPTLAARLHGTASEVAAALGDTPQARMHIDRARQLAALPAVDVATRCQVLNAAGAWASDQGHLAEARIVYEEALALARAAGDQRWQGALLGNLGGLHHVEGQLDAAAACYQQSLAHLGSVSDSRWIMNTRGNLGMIHLENGRSAEAAAEFTQALTMARSLGQARVEAPMLCNLGLVADAAGDMALAGERYSAAVDCAQRVGDRRSTAQFSAYRASALARTGRLAEAQSCIDHGRAAIHGLADPLGEGLLWCSLAELHDAQGRDCTPALERTQAVLTAQGWAPESELGRRHACVVTRLRRAQRSRGNPMHPRRGGQGP